MNAVKKLYQTALNPLLIKPSRSLPDEIAVIGAGDPSAEEAALAEETGREIARQGAVLVCGGLGGVMASAAAGAASPISTPISAAPIAALPIVIEHLASGTIPGFRTFSATFSFRPEWSGRKSRKTRTALSGPC